jgi:Cu2+-exporting ATPase
VRWVFSFALVYNMSAVGLSLAGHMSPLLAAILMPLSSIVTLGIARTVFGRFGGCRSATQDARSTPQGMHGQAKPLPV